jgi:hypothetical protein
MRVLLFPDDTTCAVLFREMVSINYRNLTKISNSNKICPTFQALARRTTIHLSMHTYIHTYIQTDRQTDRKIDGIPKTTFS